MGGNGLVASKVNDTKGRLPLKGLPQRLLEKAHAALGYEWVPFNLATISFLSKPTSIHRDPFDHLLIAQAITGWYTLVTLVHILG